MTSKQPDEKTLKFEEFMTAVGVLTFIAIFSFIIFGGIIFITRLWCMDDRLTTIYEKVDSIEQSINYINYNSGNKDILVVKNTGKNK